MSTTAHSARETATRATAPASGVAGAHAHIMADRVWLVLARRTYEEPLHEIGTIEADDAALARVYAQSIYDEFSWIEMAVVPRDALLMVIEA